LVLGTITTGQLKKQGSVIPATPSSDVYKPIVEASGKFAYIAVPALGEVHQIKLDDFTTVAKHKVTTRPVRLALLGFETSALHGASPHLLLGLTVHLLTRVSRYLLKGQGSGTLP
jgi:hypothetical protein